MLPQPGFLAPRALGAPSLVGRVAVVERELHLGVASLHPHDLLRAAALQRQLEGEPELQRTIVEHAAKLTELETRQTQLNAELQGFATLDAKIDDGLRNVDGRFARLERKIDQIIDHLPRTPPDNLGSQ